uniref:SERTA domain-containing protein n=1 Tax=Nothobranchius korthausae TaxID=1143690 RepID=A0A1A8G6M4_9TELE
MILKGHKRKLPSEDVEVPDQSSPLWESQRQFVFSVSLNKYQRSQELPEPSLRRSVLIANTLRQISLEACRSPPLDQQASEPSCSFPLSAQNNAADRSCCSGEPGVPVTEDEDWGLMATDSDFSLSAAISSILTALDSSVDGSPQAAPRTPLRSLENLSGPSEGGVALVKQGSRDHSIRWEQEVAMEAVRTSYMDDVTMEGLFQDIDSSQLEKEMGVLGLRSGAGGCSAGNDLIRYLPPLTPPSSHPFSFSLNSNLKCLPSFSSFSPSSSSSPSSSAASASFSAAQNQMREGFELEQLMEILVES